MTPPGERPRHLSMIRGFHLADLFTLVNAACGVGAVFAAMSFVELGARGAFFLAAALGPVALLCDALVTTEGFRHVLEIARQSVPQGYGNSYFRMLAAAADGRFSALVVRDVDRLSRNDEELPSLIYSLRDSGVEIWVLRRPEPGGHPHGSESWDAHHATVKGKNDLRVPYDNVRNPRSVKEGSCRARR